MAANLNRVLLIGNLTREPELRYVPSGQAVASFTVAVNRFYNDKAGQRQQEASFIRVVVWGRRAEVCGQFLTKGSPVFIEGRLQSRNWQTQDGQKRSTIEVVANSVQFLGRGKSGDQPQHDNTEETFEDEQTQPQSFPPQENGEVPF